MKVVILCGGLGTRLREETEYRPKPMVPIGERPILWHIMKRYASFGHKEFVLCLGYKGEKIKDYFLNYRRNVSDLTIKLGASPEIKYHSACDEEDWTITMVDTGLNTMTGGRVSRAMEFIEDETFLLTYGDGVSDHDINDSIEFHRSEGAVVTLTAVHPEGRFGELHLEGSRVQSFFEKPLREAKMINGGFFVCNRQIQDFLGGDDCVLEREPLEEIASRGLLAAYKHLGFWQCMDTFREHQLLEGMWSSKKAAWVNWTWT